MQLLESERDMRGFAVDRLISVMRHKKSVNKYQYLFIY